MEKARVIYGVLWILATIVYFLPWAKVDDRVFTGYAFTVPFSFTYLIGIILGLIVLATKWAEVLMTLIAGILMILGVFGAMFGFTIVGALAGFTSETATMEAGIGLAFLLSIIYTIAGTIAARKI